MNESDFVVSSVAYGLKEGQFDHLDKDDKKALLKLMARISECSYRRGVQQSAVLSSVTPEMVGYIKYNDLRGWRFESSLAQSKGIDGVDCTSAKRLKVEYRCLDSLGLSMNERTLV